MSGPRVRLWEIAHARAGDKGDTLNIGLFAYDERHFDHLVREVTVERVAALFAARRPAAVRRYLLPRLAAMNLVIEGALEGGVNAALGLDRHGKALAFLLLGLEIAAPCPPERLPHEETRP